MWWWLAGCGAEGDPDAITYHRDVQPVLAERCGGCHVEGGIAEDWFTVGSYASVQAWSEPIVDAMRTGRMPPWTPASDGECAPPLPWLDDPRPTEAEKQLVADWVDAGAPEGDRKDAPPAPEPPERLDANHELSFQTPFAVSGDEDIYQCFRIPLGLAADEWLTGLEIVPDNGRVVHHVLVWNDPYDLSAGVAGPDGSYPCDGDPSVFPTELLGSWTPGTPAFEAPDDAGAPLFAGGSLVLNVHYHPTGTSTEIDRSAIRLRTTSTPPSKHFTMYLLDLPFGAVSLPGPNDAAGPEFRIPAGVADHTETVALDLPTYIPWDLEVFQVGPHMHYLGTDMKVWIERGGAGGEEECLLHDPGYRFDFQNIYGYDGSAGAWPVVRPGDRLAARCTYDNSASNPYLGLHLEASGTATASDITWGEETGDEMCMARIGILLPPINWFDLLY